MIPLAKVRNFSRFLFKVVFAVRIDESPAPMTPGSEGHVRKKQKKASPKKLLAEDAFSRGEHIALKKWIVANSMKEGRRNLTNDQVVIYIADEYGREVRSAFRILSMHYYFRYLLFCSGLPFFILDHNKRC